MARHDRTARLRLETLEARETPSVFTVTNTADSGSGSLRDAITASNQNNGPDEIRFNIPGTGVHTIRPVNQLPDIRDTVTIDGFSQPGSQPNSLAVGDNSIHLIEIAGHTAGSDNGTDSGFVIERASNVTIRGLVINGFEHGVIMDTSLPNDNLVVVGNFIGTNATGTAAVPNNNGVRILPSAQGVAQSRNTRIGGTSPADRNVISGSLVSGVELSGSDHVVQGNYIGTTANGLAPLGNGGAGIVFKAVEGGVIGGSTAAAGNVISANNLGIFLTNDLLLDQGAANLVIANNKIGVDANGQNDLGNNFDGIEIERNIVQDSTIQSNIIANNGNDGIVLEGGSALLPDSDGIRILGNSIFNNAGQGIDLADDGVTANDTGDGDSGPNRRQNFPVITSAVFDGTNTVIKGTLNSNDSTSYRIDLFASDAADASGFGEGQTFLGVINVSTNSSGNTAFTATFAGDNSSRFISGTATDLATGDTSEFSQVRRVKTDLFATGTSSGEQPLVKLFHADGSLRSSFLAFDAAFLGGVRVATADVTNDGTDDLIAGAGPGGGPNVRVFDGRTGQQLQDFFAYAATFTGGVFVAGGDLNGDGRADVVTGAGATGGPHVRAFNGVSGSLLTEFFAYDASFLGGVSVAVGNVIGTGFSGGTSREIVVGPGPGAALPVTVFNGQSGALIQSFSPFGTAFTGGVFVSAGDVDGNGREAILTSPATLGQTAAQVKIHRFNATIPTTTTLTLSGTLGAVTTTIDRNGDGRADIVVGRRGGKSSAVKTFDAATLAEIDDFDAYGLGVFGGIFVG